MPLLSGRDGNPPADDGKPTIFKRMEKMISVKIDEIKALNWLMERLEYWTNDTLTIQLYEKMYQNYLDCGVFDGGEFDPMIIVDNDYVNLCTVLYASDEDFKKVLKVYKEQGLGDCSCEIDGYSYIEAVDDEDEPTAFLMRC